PGDQRGRVHVAPRRRPAAHGAARARGRRPAAGLQRRGIQPDPPRSAPGAQPAPGQPELALPDPGERPDRVPPRKRRPDPFDRLRLSSHCACVQPSGVGCNAPLGPTRAAPKEPGVQGTHMSKDLENFLGGGAPGLKFPTKGTSYRMTLTGPPEMKQQVDFDTGDPLEWPDGKPRMQMVLTGTIPESEWWPEYDDDLEGEVRCFIKS